MTTYVFRDGKLVDKSRAKPLYSGNAASYVISDTMDATLHHCDGKLYTSKAQFRKTTRAHGCVEYGNESATLMKPRQPIQLDRGQRREAIRKTIYDLRNGRA
jgi:hypothetical protein